MQQKLVLLQVSSDPGEQAATKLSCCDAALIYAFTSSYQVSLKCLTKSVQDALNAAPSDAHALPHAAHIWH